MVMTLIALRSDNKKTGPVALAVSRTQESCPTTCALYGAGCYAENYGVGGSATIFQRAEKGGEPDYVELRLRIRKLRKGEVVRLNVSGDYLKDDGTPDLEYIEITNTIPRWVDVLSYTHAWRLMEPGWFFDHARPNASCDTPADAAEAIAAGWKAVVVDPDGGIPGTRIAGALAVSCPAETKGIQCIDCRLCARQNRPSVVVFQIHGTKKRKAREAVMARSGS